MSYTRFLGIDPGKEGAWVLLSDKREIITHRKMPVLSIGTKKELDVASLHDDLGEVARTFPGQLIVAIERIHAMPRQGVSSMFSLGEVIGILKGLVVGLKLPFIMIDPRIWKKTLLVGVGKALPAESPQDASKRRKEESVLAAQRLFPESYQIVYNGKDRADHNVADALLIAEWLRRHFRAGEADS